MSSLNKVTLIGRVGKDPEIRKTKDGKKIASFSVATSEAWKDKNTGEKREKTEWHNVTCFNEGLAGVIEKYVNKGNKIYVEGSLATEKYTDKDGVEKYTTKIILQNFNGNIILLGGKNDAQSDNAQSDNQSDNYQTPVDDELDDDIPF